MDLSPRATSINASNCVLPTFDVLCSNKLIREGLQIDMAQKIPVHWSGVYFGVLSRRVELKGSNMNVSSQIMESDDQVLTFILKFISDTYLGQRSLLDPKKMAMAISEGFQGELFQLYLTESDGGLLSPRRASVSLLCQRKILA